MTLDFITEMGWKSAVISGAALAVLTLLRSRSAADRAAVLRLAVVLLLMLPLLSVGMPALQVEEPTSALPSAIVIDAAPEKEAVAAPIARTVGGPPVVKNAAVEVGPRAVAPTVGADRLRPDTMLLMGYAAGVLLLMARLLAGLLTLRRWTRRAEPVASSVWTGAFRRARSDAGASARVRLLASDEATAPMSWGLRTPVILIDRATLDRPEDAEAILAHELAHVVRRDWPMLMLSRVAAALFWFNPLVWLLERALVQHAEEAADLHAVDAVEPASYAQTLVTCFRHAAGASIPANSIAGHGLSRRVSAILDAGRRATPSGSPWTTTAMVVCVAIAAPIAALEMVPPVTPPAAPLAPAAPVPPPAAAPSAPTAPATPAVPKPPAALEVVQAPEAPDAPDAPEPPASPRLAGLDATIAAAATGPVTHAVASAEAAARAGAPAAVAGRAAAAEGAKAAAAGAAAAASGVRAAAAYGDVGLIDPDALIQMRIHGLDADYLEGMAAAGPRFARLAPKEMIALRIHGLTPAKLRQLAELGYGNADQDDLVAMAIHGVSPAFIRDMAAAGYRNLPAEKLVAMRIHGVSASAARRANASGRHLSADELIERTILGTM